MRIRKSRYFACDFETTVYKGQVNTEVWASASVELFTDDVHIFHSIDEQFKYFETLKCNVIAYYHNLKFDGAFNVFTYFAFVAYFAQSSIDTNENTVVPCMIFIAVFFAIIELANHTHVKPLPLKNKAVFK